MNKFEITILGCGSATPTLRHMPTSQIVNIREKLYMIDCGEGAQMQMRRMKQRFNRLNHIFISHLHGDHCFGLPGLLSTLGLLGRKGDLVIHGPKGLEHFVQPILKIFCREMPYRVELNLLDAKCHALVMEDRSLSVYSIPLNHRIATCGYLFEEKAAEAHLLREMIDFYQIPIKELRGIKQGNDFVTPSGELIPNSRLTRPAAPPKRYAFCSDTAYDPSIIPYIRGVDCLYHEATFLEEDKARAVSTFHSTAAQAASIASQAEVKQLILGHYSARYNDLSLFLKEAQPIFEKSALGMEGMCVNLR